jgi:hypothetical protein
MEMQDSGMPDKFTKIRHFVAQKHSWLAAIAGLALVLSIATGCKHQPGIQQPVARTDQQISGDIQSKIQSEAALAGQNIQISVANGVATLNGTVGDDASRALAGNDSGSVNGVRTVVNNLIVQPAQQASAPPAAPRAPRQEMRPEHSNREQAHSVSSQPMPQPARSAAPVQAYAATPSTPAPPRPVVQQITLGTGTAVLVTLTETLDSKMAQPNDVFHGALAGDLVSNGVVVIPHGSAVLGRVVDAKEAAHFKGNAFLTLELTQVTVRGRNISLVTDTYTKTGAARGKNTAEKAGGGAAFGAIIGALAGGGKGAAIGALAGGGAGTGVNAVTRGQQVQIPSETRLGFRLQSPITVSVTIPSSGRQEYERNAGSQLQQR